MSLRVLHAPTNVGGHPQGLATAERQRGLESWCVDLESAGFAYEVDERVAPGPLAVERKRFELLRRGRRDYDVVHFNFGRSLFPARPPRLLGAPWGHLPGRLWAEALAQRDLPLLRRAGKTIVVTYQGDDARQGTGPDVPASHRELASAVAEGYYTPRGDRIKRRAIAGFERHADRIFYLNPDLGLFLPERAAFVPYAHVDPRAWQPAAIPERLPDVPRIVHAPSHRGIKGTRHVLEAVSRLQAEGLRFEFVLVEGRSHAEARAEYERADLFVDQLLVGWYGGASVELMALGKPVVCHIDEATVRRFAPGELADELPVVRATPGDIASALRELLTSRRDEYGSLARRARAYVERWHDPAAIAARMEAEYEAARAERG